MSLLLPPSPAASPTPSFRIRDSVSRLLHPEPADRPRPRGAACCPTRHGVSEWCSRTASTALFFLLCIWELLQGLSPVLLCLLDFLSTLALYSLLCDAGDARGALSDTQNLLSDIKMSAWWYPKIPWPWPKGPGGFLPERWTFQEGTEDIVLLSAARAAALSVAVTVEWLARPTTTYRTYKNITFLVAGLSFIYLSVKALSFQFHFTPLDWAPLPLLPTGCAPWLFGLAVLFTALHPLNAVRLRRRIVREAIFGLRPSSRRYQDLYPHAAVYRSLAQGSMGSASAAGSEAGGGGTIGGRTAFLQPSAGPGPSQATAVGQSVEEAATTGRVSLAPYPAAPGPRTWQPRPRGRSLGAFFRSLFLSPFGWRALESEDWEAGPGQGSQATVDGHFRVSAAASRPGQAGQAQAQDLLHVLCRGGQHRLVWGPWDKISVWMCPTPDRIGSGGTENPVRMLQLPDGFHVHVHEAWPTGPPPFSSEPGSSGATTVATGRTGTMGQAAQDGSTAVIFLHGLGAGSFRFGRVLQSVADGTGLRAIALDRPGYGLTSPLALSDSASLPLMDMSDNQGLEVRQSQTGSAGHEVRTEGLPSSSVPPALFLLTLCAKLGIKRAVLVGEGEGAWSALSATAALSGLPQLPAAHGRSGPGQATEGTGDGSTPLPSPAPPSSLTLSASAPSLLSALPDTQPPGTSDKPQHLSYESGYATPFSSSSVYQTPRSGTPAISTMSDLASRSGSLRSGPLPSAQQPAGGGVEGSGASGSVEVRPREAEGSESVRYSDVSLARGIAEAGGTETAPLSPTPLPAVSDTPSSSQPQPSDVREGVQGRGGGQFWSPASLSGMLSKGLSALLSPSSYRRSRTLGGPAEAEEGRGGRGELLAAWGPSEREEEHGEAPAEPGLVGRGLGARAARRLFQGRVQHRDADVEQGRSPLLSHASASDALSDTSPRPAAVPRDVARLEPPELELTLQPGPAPEATPRTPQTPSPGPENFVQSDYEQYGDYGSGLSRGSGTCTPHVLDSEPGRTSRTGGGAPGSGQWNANPSDDPFASPLWNVDPGFGWPVPVPVQEPAPAPSAAMLEGPGRGESAGDAARRRGALGVSDSASPSPSSGPTLYASASSDSSSPEPAAKGLDRAARSRSVPAKLDEPDTTKALPLPNSGATMSGAHPPKAIATLPPGLTPFLPSEAPAPPLPVPFPSEPPAPPTAPGLLRRPHSSHIALPIDTEIVAQEAVPGSPDVRCGAPSVTVIGLVLLEPVLPGVGEGPGGSLASKLLFRTNLNRALLKPLWRSEILSQLTQGYQDPSSALLSPAFLEPYRITLGLDGWDAAMLQDLRVGQGDAGDADARRGVGLGVSGRFLDPGSGRRPQEAREGGSGGPAAVLARRVSTSGVPVSVFVGEGPSPASQGPRRRPGHAVPAAESMASGAGGAGAPILPHAVSRRSGEDSAAAHRGALVAQLFRGGEGARVRVLGGAGRHAPEEAPGELAEALGSFVRDVAGQ